MRGPGTCVLSTLILLLLSASAFGEEKQADAPVYVHGYTPDPGTTLPPHTPLLSFRLNAGTFHTNSNPGQLSNEGGGSAFGFELGVLPEELLSYRLEFMSVWRRYDTTIPPPAWGSVSSRMDLDTSAFLLGIRGSIPRRKAYRFHATAGIGYFASELWVSGSLMGMPGEVSKKDSSFGYHAGAGFEFDAGNWVVGVDYRRWFVNASFSTFGISGADIGGNYLGLGIGRLFR